MKDILELLSLRSNSVAACIPEVICSNLNLGVDILSAIFHFFPFPVQATGQVVRLN